MPRLLISGANGFIGTHLRRGLQQRGLSWSPLQRSSAQWPAGLSALELSGVDAVVHLATPRIIGTEPWDQLVQDTLVPLQGLIAAIEKSNPACCLIFVSSQSASAQTPSLYGQLKWQSEQLLRSSKIPWVIIRPGLVIGEGSRGLFSTLVRLVETSPIIPLIGDGEQLIQPVPVSAVIDAIVEVCRAPGKYAGSTFQLALPPVRLKDLLASVAHRRGKARAFVPIPEGLVRRVLWLGEKVMEKPPLTQVNLNGLLHLEVMDAAQSLERLGLKLPSLDESLAQALEPDAVAAEARYLAARLFNRTLDEQSVERYRAACRLLPDSPEAEASMKKLVALRLDPEAVEFALRRSGSQLTKRIQILAYLLEFRGDCFELFVNTRERRGAAFVQLGVSGLRAALKLSKGKYLVMRHGLV